MAGSWIAPPDQPPPAVHLGAVGFEPERGAVVGVVAAGPDLHHHVQRHVADRVDALDLALADPSDPAALVQQVAASGLPVLVSLPVLASTSAASALEGACGAGAAGVRTPAATASDELLAQAVAWDATVVLTASSPDEARRSATRAATAGIPRNRLVLEVPLSLVPDVRSLGWPVAVTIPSGPLPEVVAAAALARAAGAGLLRVVDGRAARRASAVMAAVLAARDPEETTP